MRASSTRAAAICSAFRPALAPVLGAEQLVEQRAGGVGLGRPAPGGAHGGHGGGQVVDEVGQGGGVVPLPLEVGDVAGRPVGIVDLGDPVLEGPGVGAELAAPVGRGPGRPRPGGTAAPTTSGRSAPRRGGRAPR